MGEIVGTSKNTVDSVRESLKRNGEIDHFEKLRGKDRKFRNKRRQILTNTEDEADEAADIIDQLPETDKIIPFKLAKRKAYRLKRQKEREEAAANAPPWNERTSSCITAVFRICRRRRGLSQGRCG